MSQLQTMTIIALVIAAFVVTMSMGLPTVQADKPVFNSHTNQKYLGICYDQTGAYTCEAKTNTHTQFRTTK